MKKLISLNCFGTFFDPNPAYRIPDGNLKLGDRQIPGLLLVFPIQACPPDILALLRPAEAHAFLRFVAQPSTDVSDEDLDKLWRNEFTIQAFRVDLLKPTAVISTACDCGDA